MKYRKFNMCRYAIERSRQTVNLLPRGKHLGASPSRHTNVLIVFWGVHLGNRRVGSKPIRDTLNYYVEYSPVCTERATGLENGAMV